MLSHLLFLALELTKQLGLTARLLVLLGFPAGILVEPVADRKGHDRR